jgi:hypothetical protein
MYQLQMKNLISGKMLCIILCLGVWLAGQADAQESIRLREAGTNSDRTEVEVGEMITVEVFADLGDTGTSGLTLFITVPAEHFLVIDQIPVDVSEVKDNSDSDETPQPGAGTQPFKVGDLFVGKEQRNTLHSPGEVIGVLEGGRVLEYQLLVGVGEDRSRTGSGVVGTFQLIAIKAVENTAISILDNPGQETRVVLPEGGERRFKTEPQGMEVDVLDIQSAVEATTWAAVKSFAGNR